LGASSLAIGLALKDFLSNIAAGVILVFQKPFEYGDLVEISGTLGVVEYIDLFNVKIKTSSNEIVVIPNGMLIQGKIINKAYRGKRRLEIIASIAYDSDLIKAKTLLHDIVLQVDKILKDPAPSVVVSRLAESSVDLSIKMWLKKEHYLEVQGEVLEKIKLIFDKNDIQIPYPQMELSVKKRLHS
jgi:small conductance mechanosensitive channel